MKKIFTLEYRVDESWHLDKFKEVSEVFRQVKTMETLKENTRYTYRFLITTKLLHEL